MATATGKQRNLRGKRTGIQIPESNDDDLDKVFAGATSPPATQDGEADSVQYTVERSARKKKQLRFSIGPDDSSKNSTENENGGDVTRLVSGLQRATRQSLSPSELSKVSTAPPSLDRSTVTQFDEEEIGRTLQEHGGDDDFSPLLKAKIGEDIADLPITQDDMDDDLIPPAPDDNSDTEDENPDFLSPKTPARSPAPVEKRPGQSSPALDDTDDEDDGVGFQMADDDHQTPMLSTKGSSMSSREEEKKKKKKKQKSASDETTEVHEPLRKQKKKLKNRTFSPKGMQSGPLTYKHVVPVTDPKDEPEEGLRRSKRMRIAPLAFWKNEGADYVPNDFDDDLVDGLETMPVVKAYRIAEKTPYKKRKVPVANHQEQNTKAKKSVSSKAAMPAEAEFDSSKLKKKYKYIDSDTAYVWDDCYERADDLGKLIL
jgi:centromere protein C